MFRHVRDVLSRHSVLAQRSPGGGILFLVACSNAYANCSSFGSLHAPPVNPTPKGCGFGSNPEGSGSGGGLSPPRPSPPRPPRPPKFFGPSEITPNGASTVG